MDAELSQRENGGYITVSQIMTPIGFLKACFPVAVIDVADAAVACCWVTRSVIYLSPLLCSSS